MNKPIEVNIIEANRKNGAYVDVVVTGVGRFRLGLMIIRFGAWLCGFRFEVTFGEKHENSDQL